MPMGVIMHSPTSLEILTEMRQKDRKRIKKSKSERARVRDKSRLKIRIL